MSATLSKMNKAELYIKCKQLKEENDKIAIAHIKSMDEKQKLLDDIELHPDYEDTIESTIETAQKELKEENEELKQEVKDYHTLELRLRNKIKKLQKDRNELKEENEKLSSDNDTIEQAFDGYKNEWDRLENNPKFKKWKIETLQERIVYECNDDDSDLHIGNYIKYLEGELVS